MSDVIKKIEPPKYVDEYFKPEMLSDEMQQLLAAKQLLRKQINDVRGNCSHVFVRNPERDLWSEEATDINLICRNCGQRRWADPMDMQTAWTIQEREVTLPKTDVSPIGISNIT